MESWENDLDLAFQLQLQETMNFSLCQPQMQENQAASPDPRTLKLLEKFEQEEKDAQECEAEMQRLREDLKIQSHDHKFAQEILQIPDDEWEDYGGRVNKPFSGASSSSEPAIDDAEPFRVYSKGLFSIERVGEGPRTVSTAAIGAAVCDPHDTLILNVQKPLVGDWESDWESEDMQFKVEVIALMEGLNAALSLDIKRVDVFCDYYPLFHYISMKWLNKQQKSGTRVDRICLLQQKFDSCRPFFVARKDVKFAFRLARDTLDIQITRSAESSNARDYKEKCSICLEETDVRQMLVVEDCKHRYCPSCMKQHVEVKLLHGIVPRCPHEGCNTEIDIPICTKFLSPELIALMSQLIRESSVPVVEKVYCPYPRCSALMSKTEILSSTDVVFADRSAVQCTNCHGAFCINCKVPWHSNMTCRNFKRRNPNTNAGDANLKSLATTRSWRQCPMCNNMIELAEGCYHITCRCGYEFCYTCGAEWHSKKATCTCPIWDEHNIVNDE